MASYEATTSASEVVDIVNSYDDRCAPSGSKADKVRFIQSSTVDKTSNTTLHLGIHAPVQRGKVLVLIKCRPYLPSCCIILVGDQLDYSDNICGAMLSIRFNEDILCVWNRNASDNQTMMALRDNIKRHLKLPHGLENVVSKVSKQLKNVSDTLASTKRHLSKILENLDW
ncbi:eukaryotic translation initiation factor NCBP [Tanacetum coccineum]